MTNWMTSISDGFSNNERRTWATSTHHRWTRRLTLNCWFLWMKWKWRNAYQLHIHSVWKSQKSLIQQWLHFKSRQKFIKKCQKMVNFGDFLKICRLWSTSVTRQVNLIGQKFVESANIENSNATLPQCFKITQNIAFEFFNYGIFQQFLPY